MKVLVQREVDRYEEKVTIEFTVRELAIIGAAMASASRNGIRESLGNHLINLLEKDVIQSSSSDNTLHVYEEVSDILRDKGVFR